VLAARERGWVARLQARWIRLTAHSVPHTPGLRPSAAVPGRARCRSCRCTGLTDCHVRTRSCGLIRPTPLLPCSPRAPPQANDYETAVVEYNRSIEVLSGYRGRKLDVETRRRFMDCFLKSVGNTAQGMLKLPAPDNMQVVQLTSEAMQMDGEDEFKQRGKNLRRRGIALYNLGQWAMAAQDLRDAMATDKAFASDKVRAAAATVAATAATAAAACSCCCWAA